MLVCNGVVCHHLKRASLQQKVEVQQKKLDLIILKGKIIQLVCHLRQSTDSISLKKDIEAKQQKHKQK